MIERSPVLWHEVASTQSFEELERVIGAEVTSPEARFPPRCVTNRKKCDIEISSVFVNNLGNDTMCFRCETSVASEEACFAACGEQVHVSRATPTIDRVATPLVLCAGRMHYDRPYRDLAVCW